MEEFKSFYKNAEVGRCKYPTRLDVYGCGCAHDCSYCYAKSLLSFRGLWNPQEPRGVDLRKVENKLRKIAQGSVLRLGGMTDCFQPVEKKYRLTLETIKLLNKYRIHYLIITKSSMCADEEYMKVYDKELCHIQVTVTTFDDKLSTTYEKASVPSERIKAIKKLQDKGFDVAIRLSPIMEEYMDFNQLNSLGINKAIVEFLRVNSWIKKWFNIDYSKFTLKSGGYQHLQLEDKVKVLEKIHIPSVSVCEDVPSHYEFWRDHYNPNKCDCCNLTMPILELEHEQRILD